MLCSLSQPEGRARGVMCVEIIKSGSFISLLNNRLSSRSKMSCAHGSILSVCFFLRCLCLIAWSHLALSCRVQNLYLHLLVYQKLQSMFTPLHLSECRAGMPVSFPEGMVSGRPRSGLSMPIFSIE